MDERSKHRMKCYLGKTSALTSTDRTCCLFPSMGFSSTASERKGEKKPGMEMKLWALRGWRLPYTLTWTGEYGRTREGTLKKAHLHKELRSLHSCLILIVPTQVCIQKRTPLHALKSCFTKRFYNLKESQTVKWIINFHLYRRCCTAAVNSERSARARQCSLPLHNKRGIYFL